MEANGVLLCDNLMKWLQTLDLKAKHGNPSDYHQDILNLSLQEFSRPDVVNIAETADPTDLGRRVYNSDNGNGVVMPEVNNASNTGMDELVCK
ncbi:Hook protein [Operophtera brumata]|uniref:Hook protein n=1 Tax=Operophtera brumata TaxID=104452 RepID=A0A0L7LJQ7_OPEBR|nr:Hook protein [Operophtera brumata]